MPIPLHSPFSPPLDEAVLNDLRWYLENYIRWPSGPDFDRAERIETEMEGWGRLFFDALFSNLQAIRLWQQFRDRADSYRLLTLDATDYRILRLPWELLADEEGHLFGLGIPVRRRVHKLQAAQPHAFDLPLRVLMIVARPEGENVSFIDPRASARALLDAVEPLGKENVVVEFLHPPTLKSLTERLRSEPPVHVVHFDGHGVYNIELGLGYLLFEGQDGKLDMVDADRLGTLLSRAQTPMMVLDACQSAHADAPDPYSSVAARLIRAGVGSVVAMQYSVLVETSKRFMAAFYQALAQGRTIGAAVDEGRADLLADTHRLTLYQPDGSERRLNLRDWFLPALYQQAADLAPFAGAVLRPTTEAKPASNLRGDFPEPRYGFVGRGRELWRLERLLHDRRIIVLHGFGGQGKTALATEAAAWLTRAGRFVRALFLSFERGGDSDWAVDQLGSLAEGEDFASLEKENRMPALKDALSESPTLIVWDNFESVLTGGNAELSSDALQELLELGADLTDDGSTCLLATTRDPELPHDAFHPSQTAAQLTLRGLEGREALELAGAILDALGHDRPPRPDLERLLNFLGRHPLSILLVVPHLKDYLDVATVIDRFEQLYPGFTEGKAQERNESLDVSLSFSLARLSNTVQTNLPNLGVFAGGTLDFMAQWVTGISPEDWGEVRGELLKVGLMTEEPLLFPWMDFLAETTGQDVPTEMRKTMAQVSYLHFHPTLCPHLRRRLDEAQRAELEERYRQLYHAVSTYLYHADKRNPHEIRAVVLRELPNLRRALELTLAAGDMETAVDFADNLERFLNVFGRWREREAMMAKVEAATKAAGATVEGPLTKEAFLQEGRRGEILLDQGRAQEAEQIFRRLLKRMDIGAAYDSTYYRAITLQRFGRSLKSQGSLHEAETEYRRALEVLAGMDQERSDVRRETGIAHASLADVLMNQGRYVEARKQYEAGLEIAKSQNDRRQEAAVLGNLGTLAMMEGDYPEAQRRFREALERFHALGETRSEAILWHQLGMVAQEVAGRVTGEQRAAFLDEAEKASRESLWLSESIGDKPLAAVNAYNLAGVTQMAGRPADAERWYRRAIEDFEATGQHQYIARTAQNLAGLFLTVHRLPTEERPSEFAGRDLLAEAEKLAHQAREIMEEIGDLSLSPWATYSILAQIAEEQGDAEAVRAWRRKERKAYIAFPGHWARMEPQFGPLVQAIAVVARGDSAGAQNAAVLQGLLGALAQSEEGQNLSAAILRVFDGARDADALAEELSLARASYLILRKVLEAVGGNPE